MLSYRPGTVDDWAAIDRIFRDSFCATFAHLYRREDLDAFLSKFSEEAWQSELTDPRYDFLIAESDGEPIGYVKLGPLGLPVEPGGPALELKQLYLLHEWRGLGAATHLMDWALGKARERGAAELYLSVYTDNHRARAFYRRYGFEEVGPYAFMVGNHADEDIIARCRL